MNLEALLDIDADPLDSSPLESAVAWLGNHGAMRLYAWWLDRTALYSVLDLLWKDGKS